MIRAPLPNRPFESLPNALVGQRRVRGQPSIPVFVIGVGEELSALNAIAEAGGHEERSRHCDTGNVTSSSWQVNGIRKSALSCTRNPAPTTGQIDYDAVNVTSATLHRAPKRLLVQARRLRLSPRALVL